MLLTVALNSADPPLLHLTVQQLEYLVAAVEHDTWADAALSLGVSASAMSQGMAELQRRIGVELFVREGRRMVARPGAAVVVAYARRVLAETRDLARWASQARVGSVGRVAVGMIDAAAIHYFGDALAQYRRDHPDVELHLRVAPSAQLFGDLQDGLLDLAVGVDRDDLPRTDMSIDSLVAEELFVYAPDGQERLPPRRWGPWVTFPADSHTRRLVSRAVRDLGAPFEVIAESSQPDVLREMVHLGVGWAVLPRLEAERGPHPLIPARKTAVATRQLVLARRSNRLQDAAAQELAACLLAAL